MYEAFYEMEHTPFALSRLIHIAVLEGYPH